MPVMVYHQCFRGIDCYSSLQKLFAEVFFDFGALQTWSTWVATYGYYIDDFALSKFQNGSITSFRVYHISNKCELLWTCDKLQWTYHNSAKFKGELAN